MNEKLPTLTVRELIERLQAVDQDLKVVLEGCDCWGDCASTVQPKGSNYDGGDNYVLLTRVDSYNYPEGS